MGLFWQGILAIVRSDCYSSRSRRHEHLQDSFSCRSVREQNTSVSDISRHCWAYLPRPLFKEYRGLLSPGQAQILSKHPSQAVLKSVPEDSPCKGQTTPEASFTGQRPLMLTYTRTRLILPQRQSLEMPCVLSQSVKGGCVSSCCLRSVDTRP